MFATVYRTRDRGFRLPRPRQGVSGSLALQAVREAEDASVKATLTQDSSTTTSLLPDLFGARVIRISATGIAIAGYEVVARRAGSKSAVDRYEQCWWCLVHTVRLAEMLDVATEADMLFDRAHSSTGF